MRGLFALVLLSLPTLALVPYWLLPYPACSVSLSAKGTVGAVGPLGAFLIAHNGTITFYERGAFNDTDYFNGTFVFVGHGKAFLVGRVNKVFDVNGTYAKLEGEMLFVCGNGCYAYTLDGILLWRNDLDVTSKPAYSNGYLFVPSYSSVYVVNATNGKLVKKFSMAELGGLILSLTSCNDMVAVSTTNTIVIIDSIRMKITKVMKGVWGYGLAFSPDCGSLALTEGKTLLIINLKGKVLKEMNLWAPFYSVSWAGSWLALGSPTGGVLLMSR